MTYPWHLYLMAIIYIVAGIFHFIKPQIYLRIMPRYIPNHKLLVYASGIFEILLGITICIPELKNIALYAIILMLAVFLLVHFYMLSSEKASAGIPKWLLWLRIPTQFVLMYWAYSYLKL
ncbi:DoxX family protein [Changchengzhania lutea]|uniref:DoxX family protein n=1 Tax=Changchengzhania lutea TaxID=2049305 RepID=UPI00115F21E5|nr:MauE/DoxX family redox-associated membrane protein [Changchengzhania lutea]